MPQHLKFDAKACSSKPFEKASPELLEQLKKIAAFPRPASPCYWAVSYTHLTLPTTERV